VRASEKLLAYLELTRAHNLLGTALGVLAGALLVEDVATLPLAVAIVGAVLVAAGGYAVNDYFDIEIDKINKPERPIPSGRVSPKEAYALSLLLMGIGALISFVVGPVTGAFATLNAVLMYYYSKQLKRTGLVGNLAVSFSTASTILYGALAQLEWMKELQELWTVVPVFAMVFLLTLSREIVKGVEDYFGDKEGGVKTLAVVKGPKAALRIALIISVLALLSAYLAVPCVGLGLTFVAFVTLGGAISIISIYKCLKSEDPVRCASKPRRNMKVAMFLGLVGIIADRALPHVLYIQPRER